MEELIEKAKKGDKEAFTDLILENQIKLYKIAKARLKNEADIEDVVQETMIILYTKLSKLRDNTKFEIWLYKILINQCNKKYRKNKISLLSLETIENQKTYSNEENIEDKLNYEEILAMFKEQDQMLLLLYYSNGYTTKQISQILNKNENTIKTKLRRMKEKIKENYSFYN
ncbi:MAG: RNA polymerase sigma factor [Clostridia bacterium]|nr:RNA polymerase sigma factor [Clostridia bacterium]